jgi:hypothetical protein
MYRYRRREERCGSWHIISSDEERGRGTRNIQMKSKKHHPAICTHTMLDRERSTSI